MLSAELELANLDARHWRNWWQLLTPPRVTHAWALVILDGTKIERLIVRGAGERAAPPLPGLREVDLEAYAHTLGVAAVVAIDRTVIASLAAEIEAALRLDMDPVAQGLTVLRALKKHAGHGVWSAPAVLELLPAPSFESLQKTFDVLVPDRSAMVAYVIDDDRKAIHASIIALKARGDIVRAATHRAIDDLVAEAGFARDWERQTKRVAEAVEHRFARPSLALFVERATLLRVVTGPSDQLAREVNAKRVIIDPAPAWLLGLLGGAAVAAMAGRAASALASMLPSTARDAASALASRAKGALKDAHPFAPLGFDPIELWSRLKHYYRP
ncbi:MAG TPA: hypothetical protein VFP84_02125 [Kofleriaceae bacterium]|nr:hypothetical protein [Kofleriaceae bacterium]